MPPTSVSPTVLVIAGHDPTHGAGDDADREALLELGIDARVVVSAWTEQDERGVQALGARTVEEWFAQALAALDERVHALKFGLLPGRAHIEAAARLVRAARERLGRSLPVVVDPVLASSSGGRFLDDASAPAYLRVLAPEGIVLTPNLDEAAELAGMERTELEFELDARIAAARRMLDAGCAAVLLKGGHGAEDPVCDLVFEREREPSWLRHARVKGGKIRGSGCRYASRVAGELASGRSLEQAAGAAARAVAARIARRGAGGV